MDEKLENQEMAEAVNNTVEALATTKKSHDGLKKVGEVVLISSLAIAGYKGVQVLIKAIKEKKNGKSAVQTDDDSFRFSDYD